MAAAQGLWGWGRLIVSKWGLLPTDWTNMASPADLLPTVLILASGRGERFLASGGGVHKLKALLAGKPVLQHVVDAVKASGLPWHLEDTGHPGMGDSIAAAVRATPDANGWLILPGDLPLVQSETLLQLAAALETADVVVPVCNGQRGHPVGFARQCRDALLGLQGNQGAAVVVKAYVATEIIVEDAGVVTDIDTVADLDRAENLLGAGPPRRRG
jgi:molybdenum cofactor cytidylyltransferase